MNSSRIPETALQQERLERLRSLIADAQTEATALKVDFETGTGKPAGWHWGHYGSLSASLDKIETAAYHLL